MKTPKSAIELAVKYKNDYIERIHNMETLDQYLEKQLKNPKFKKEWDAFR